MRFSITTGALLTLTAIVLVAVLAVPRQSDAVPGAQAAKTCSDYSNQRQAQLKKDTRDADGDGIYCEALPCPCLKPGKQPSGDKPKSSCKRVARTIRVTLSRKRYPGSTAHIRSAIRKGEARILHIARNLAKRHRRQSLKGIPTKRGFDRDEYPPAMSREGGKGADVRYVRSSDNRGAGASMGAQLRPYCNKQAFRFRLLAR